MLELDAERAVGGQVDDIHAGAREQSIGGGALLGGEAGVCAPESFARGVEQHPLSGLGVGEFDDAHPGEFAFSGIRGAQRDDIVASAEHRVPITYSAVVLALLGWEKGMWGTEGEP